jgi:hypothetical protein
MMPINYVSASGKDIADLVDKIEDVVEGTSNLHVSIACIVVAALAQNPEIPPDRLQDVVKGVSEYMAASLFDESEIGAVN